jgi:hypothetical protein
VGVDHFDGMTNRDVAGRRRGLRMNLLDNLSRSDITIETAPDTIRCFSQARNAWAYLIGVVVLATTLIPMVIVTVPMLTRATQKRWVREGDGIIIALSLLPFLLASCVLLNVFRRRNMRRGIEVVEGVGTLYTPDLPVGRHMFDRSNLGGAQLVAAARGVDLRVQRRNGTGVPVFIGYPANLVAPVVDAVNGLVVDNRHHGFEVIPLARIAPPTAARADDQPL